MANLFAKAKKAAPAKTTKAKDEKVRLVVEDPTFFTKVQKLEELNDTMKSAKAKADMISDELRDVAKTEWLNQYERTNKNPESVMICQSQDDDTAQFMLWINTSQSLRQELKNYKKLTVLKSLKKKLLSHSTQQ